MQLTYEYMARIDFNHRDGNESKSYPIEQENIKQIIINKEYDDLNMPIITVTMSVDTNIVDLMIKDNKESTMILTINKKNTNTQSTTNIVEAYIKEECTYLIEGDVNPNKEWDNKAPTKEEAENKDKFRLIRVGLLSKRLADALQKPANLTVYNSNMQDIVMQLLNNGIPLLMEPFDYKDPIPQLILSPKESLSKSLDYLNSVKVFYETGYRFFMDFDNTYLVSKAGKSVLRKNDRYPTIKIDVKPLMGEDGMVRGIETNDTDKVYDMIVPMNDTNFNSDDLIDKSMEGIAAVVDASKQKQESFLKKHKGFGGILGAYKNILNIMDNVKVFSGQVRNVVQNIHRTTYEIKGRMIEMKEQVDDFKTTTLDLYNQTKATIASLPQEALQQIGQIDDVKNILTQINEANDKYGKYINKCIPNFDEYVKAYTGQIYNIEGTKNYVGGIKPINFQDNLGSLQTSCWDFKKDAEKTDATHKKGMAQFSRGFVGWSQNIGNISTTLMDLPDTVTYCINPKDPVDSRQYKEVDLKHLKKFSAPFQEMFTSADAYGKGITKDTATMDASNKLNRNAGATIKAFVDKAQGIPTDFSNKLLEGGNMVIKDFKSQADSAKQMFIDNKQMYRQQFNSMRDTFNVIKQGAQLSIDSFKDLGDIGSDGESLVSIALDTVETLAKQKIIRLPNDNINILKNIKHALDLQKTTITVHKLELDNDIFNINIKYMISNETEKTTRSGEYILVSKQEVYDNNGTTLVANTILTFHKLPSGKKKE